MKGVNFLFKNISVDDNAEASYILFPCHLVVHQGSSESQWKTWSEGDGTLQEAVELRTVGTYIKMDSSFEPCFN